MFNLEKFIEIMNKLPWRNFAIATYVSFALAAICSIATGYVLASLKSTPVTFGSNEQAPSGEVAALAAISFSDKDVTTIIDRNIFGSELEGSEKKKESDKDTKSGDELTKSDLPVKLHGTIYGGDPFTGIALVEDTQQRKINSFLVNDVLIRDAVVKEILRERIIVDRGGRKEFIDVERPEVKPKRGAKKTKDTPAAGSGQSVAIAPVATDPPPESYEEPGFKQEKGKIEMSTTYREKLLSDDFTKVLQDAKAMPNMVDNALKGFKLTRIRQGSIYEKAGLQNDDIIEEINGVPLTDTAQAVRLLQSLRNESEIEVRLLRGGAYQSMTVSIR